MSANIIKVNKGDSFTFKFNIPSTDGLDAAYILSGNEAVYFAVVYPHQLLADALILKGYTVDDQDEDGSITVKLSSKETSALAVGIYYYTIKLQRGGTLDVIGDDDDPEEVRTIVERTKFIINE